jgi:hypothetical protein
MAAAGAGGCSREAEAQQRSSQLNNSPKLATVSTKENLKIWACRGEAGGESPCSHWFFPELTPIACPQDPPNQGSIRENAPNHLVRKRLFGRLKTL